MTPGPVPVSVNLLWCVPGKVGGSEDYLVRQLLGLSALRSQPTVADVDVTLCVLQGFAEAHPDLAGAFRMDVAPIDGSSRARRVVAEHTWLARRTAQAALVHHGGGTVPSLGRQPTVLTIHDLQYRTFPHYLMPIKRRYLRWTMPRSAKRASVIAVPSEYVRRTVIEAYGVAEEYVVVVPHGMEPALGRRATPELELRAKFDLGDGPVLVLPAMTHPHKGHLFLLDVMATSWPDPDLRLVLIGGRGAHEGAVRSAMDREGLRGRVLRPGRVSAEDRDGLVAMSIAMVFPSEYEGFGAPVIEAMTLGAPVICSDRTSLPEVAGSAALVLPLVREAWAAALDEVIRRRDELVAAGHVRCAAFTSESSAHALLGAYALALR